jgi:tetratricopeptide (TPR) repeat protein
MRPSRDTVLLGTLLLLAGCGTAASDPYAAAERAYEAGNYERAIELYTEAIPGSSKPELFTNRGNCYWELGNVDAALEDYQGAIDRILDLTGDQKHPTLADPHFNRGYAYESTGRYREAIADYEQALRCDASYPEVKNNLAWVLATCPAEELRDPQRAIALAEAEAASTDFQDDAVLDTLAAACAAAGDFAKAVEREQQVIALAGDEESGRDYRERLELYRSGQPYFQEADVD